jgi:signal transduction histidine kinase
MPGDVVLDVRDDGRGFDPAAAGSREPAHAGTARHAPSGGFGLVAMRQRIEGVSGTLQVVSEPAAGTTISASVPVQPVETASAETMRETG